MALSLCSRTPSAKFCSPHAANLPLSRQHPADFDCKRELPALTHEGTVPETPLLIAATLFVLPARRKREGRAPTVCNAMRLLHIFALFG